MMTQRGRKPKYLTVERFEAWISNHFYHLQEAVKFNKKLLWIILGSLIVLTLLERSLGWASLVKGLLG